MQRKWIFWAALAACSSPMPMPAPEDAGVAEDSGVKVVDAGLPDAGVDAGVVDAGFIEVEPDGGPREPTTSSQVLYTDDFERYANTAALKGSYGDQREVGGAFAIDGTEAGQGTRSFRIDYSADGGCVDADVFLSKVLAITSPQTVALQYRLRYSQGFRFQQPASHCVGRGTSSTEMVIGRFMNGRGTVVLSVADEPALPVIHQNVSGLRWQVQVRDVRATVTPAQPHATYRQHLRVNRLSPTPIANARWHRVGVLLQRETMPGAGDGVIRVWIDGEAVLDYDGSTGVAAGKVFTGTPAFGSITYPSTLPSGASQAQSRWFDEVVLFEP